MLGGMNEAHQMDKQDAEHSRQGTSTGSCLPSFSQCLPDTHLVVKYNLNRKYFHGVEPLPGVAFQKDLHFLVPFSSRLILPDCTSLLSEATCPYTG